ncbi:MAG: DUF1801 domain-containing protein [Acidobacteria bacterium]|nr:DUF1801 domain-containing protein [Acidobacteriota bacterium]MCW5948663.1 DUF1801 domain-containing protein [Pyrinomonadaceae bacterium]
MRSNASTPDEYIASLPEGRREAVAAIRDVINKNLPDGYVETMTCGMIGWVVPHEIYPAGYHCDPKQPLPYINLASQKNNISLYSMCLYGSPKHLAWFREEWSKRSSSRLDMGKSCIRLKDKAIPLDLIGELAALVTVEEWIEMCESAMRRTRERRQRP